MSDKTTPRKTKKILIPVVCAALVLILAVGGTLFAVNRYLGKIDRTDENIETIPPELEIFETEPPATTLGTTAGTFAEQSENSGETVTEATTVPTEPPVTSLAPEEIEWSEIPAIGDDDILNIMLVGQDLRPGEVRSRSDVMILCSINPKTGEMSLISFLRDLYVQIPGGYSDNRLNLAYFYGGFPQLYETMYVNFGITVDGGFEVDFEGFIGLVDLLGGVDIELSSAEAALVGEGATEGMNHLNGTQALAYSRIRSIDNDFNRSGRQRTVIEAMLNKFREADTATVLALLDEALPLLTTDMSNGEIISLATALLPVMRDIEVSTYLVPESDCYSFANIRGMDVLLPNLPRIRDRLENEYLPLNK